MKKCVRCLGEGDTYSLYSFYRNKNFHFECFDEEECKIIKKSLKKEDYEEYFKEKFGSNFYDLKPLFQDKNDYFYDEITNKYFVHYDSLNENELLENKIKKTLTSYLTYPINLIDEKYVPKK